MVGLKIFAPKLIDLKAAFVDVEMDVSARDYLAVKIKMVVALAKLRGSSIFERPLIIAEDASFPFMLRYIPLLPVRGSVKMPRGGALNVKTTKARAIAASRASAIFGLLHSRLSLLKSRVS